MPVIRQLPPSIRNRDQSFRFVETARVSRTRGRVVDAEVVPFPYWMADFDLPPLESEDFGRYESFIIKHRIGRDYFRAFKTYRPRPLKMDNRVPLSGVKANSSAPFDGTCVIDNIIDPMNLTISGLPSSFVFTEGDMVELRESESVISLHMVAEDAVSGSDGSVQLEFNNPIHENVISEAATVNLEKASCLMQINEQPEQSRGLKFGEASFTAIEISFNA